MADKTQENLARIRACDADWNENDHPRADNGQFTSGSGGGGAKVSKLHSGGKAKVTRIKAGEIAKNQERYDQVHKNKQDRYLSELTSALKRGDYESARETLGSHERDKKYYDRLTKQNNKFKAAKATLEKAKPGIAKMREQAKAAAPAAAPASKKDALVKKINADPKLKAEVMSLKGKSKAPAAKPAAAANKNSKGYKDGEKSVLKTLFNTRDKDKIRSAMQGYLSDAQKDVDEWSEKLKQNPNDKTAQHMLNFSQGIFDTWQRRLSYLK